MICPAIVGFRNICTCVTSVMDAITKSIFFTVMGWSFLVRASMRTLDQMFIILLVRSLVQHNTFVVNQYFHNSEENTIYLLRLFFYFTGILHTEGTDPPQSFLSFTVTTYTEMLEVCLFSFCRDVHATMIEKPFDCQLNWNLMTY